MAVMQHSTASAYCLRKRWRLALTRRWRMPASPGGMEGSSTILAKAPPFAVSVGSCLVEFESLSNGVSVFLSSGISIRSLLHAPCKLPATLNLPHLGNNQFPYCQTLHHHALWHREPTSLPQQPWRQGRSPTVRYAHRAAP